MILCILADHEDRPFDHPQDDECIMHEENPWEIDIRVAYEKIADRDKRLAVAVEALEKIQRECLELLGASPSYLANAIKQAKSA